MAMSKKVEGMGEYYPTFCSLLKKKEGFTGGAVLEQNLCYANKNASTTNVEAFDDLNILPVIN